MGVDLSTLRVGDTIVFADGTRGVCSVSYQNGSGYFIRWDVYDENGKRRGWSGTDSYCCFTCLGKTGRHDEGMQGGCVWERPKDIIDITKPPPHELQDKVSYLRAKLPEQPSRDRATHE